ncbi:GH35 family endo-1,4-beta-xylanase [Planifilum fimeticola]|jgi:GH35 family endo-1,4-beta-xylanase|uniref:GH35 family endo-1,4-beta-xylanase n=1 Tax=Planifilum fimeticola TaxID=201975 RepID=A0A2T0LHP9_9BACL|nr:GH35 family endo-1,4-beta-xylanase [Planifilum fimeticola]
MLRSKPFIVSAALVLLLSLALPVAGQNSAYAGIADDKFLGNVIADYIPSDFATYWDQVTPENSTKWGSVESSRGNMNWSQADMAYNYAKNNGFPFKFHTLVWGSQEPGWVSSLPASEQRAEVIEWIQAAGQRYRGAEFVDVVNEPLHAPPSYKDAIGGNGSTGWDWVIWSFEQARQAFPDSKLLINEYGIISDPNAAAQYVEIIQLLKSRGLIDGIGIQCHHFNMDDVSVSTMRNVLNMLASTGLPIYVSELDMTGDDQTQLARYQEKFPVLWEHPAVQGVTIWGYIEGETWRDGTHLITRSGQERPALTWLREVYFGNGGDGGDGGGGGDEAYADFEYGTEGWSGRNLVGGPWSTDAWSAKGSRSLQGDILLSNGSQHYLYKSGNFNFSGHSLLRATVKGATWGNYGNGLGVKLYVKYGSNYTWKDSGWQTIRPGEQRELTLNLSGVNTSDIREYGVQFIGTEGSSGQTSVYVDNVYLWD